MLRALTRTDNDRTVAFIRFFEWPGSEGMPHAFGSIAFDAALPAIDKSDANAEALAIS